MWNIFIKSYYGGINACESCKRLKCEFCQFQRFTLKSSLQLIYSFDERGVYSRKSSLLFVSFVIPLSMHCLLFLSPVNEGFYDQTCPQSNLDRCCSDGGAKWNLENYLCKESEGSQCEGHTNKTQKYTRIFYSAANKTIDCYCVNRSTFNSNH